MLIAIRNLLFQPMSFELNGDVGGLHLCSRERKTIAKEQLSNEIKSAADRGIVSVTEIPGSTQHDLREEVTDDEHTLEDVLASKSRKRRQE